MENVNTVNALLREHSKKSPFVFESLIYLSCTEYAAANQQPFYASDGNFLWVIRITWLTKRWVVHPCKEDEKSHQNQNPLELFHLHFLIIL